jgi:hypothetical protein
MQLFLARSSLIFGAVMTFLGFIGTLIFLLVGHGGIAVAALLLGVVGAVLFYKGVRGCLSEIAKMAATPLIGGQVGNYVAHVAETRQYQGRAYVVFYQPPVKKRKNRRPSSLTIRVPAVTPAMHFNKENWFDRLCKHVGIAREHQTGDVVFDRAVYVRSPSDGYAEKYLNDAQKRAAVLALKRQGFHEVRLTGKRAEAIWKGFDPASHDRPGLTDDASRALLVLGSNLPRHEEDPFARPDRHATWLKRLWLFALALAPLSAFAYFYPPIREAELCLAALGVFIVAYPMFAWVAASLLGGKSTSHDRWVRLMLAGVLLLGLGSIGGVAAVNALADNSPPEVRKIVVTNKRMSEGHRGSKSYYAVVPAWDRAGETLEFQVSWQEYEAIVPHQTQLELTLGPGRLGIEWLKAQRLGM